MWCARGCAWRDGRGRLLAAGTVSSSVCSERTSVDRIAAPMVGASQLEDEEPSDEDGDAARASAAAPAAKKKKRKKMNEKGAAAGAAEAAELTTVLDGATGRLNSDPMVDVAQLVERWLVMPDVAGSSPVFHPTYLTVSLLRMITRGDRYV